MWCKACHIPTNNGVVYVVRATGFTCGPYSEGKIECMSVGNELTLIYNAQNFFWVWAECRCTMECDVYCDVYCVGERTLCNMCSNYAIQTVGSSTSLPSVNVNIWGMAAMPRFKSSSSYLVRRRRQRMLHEQPLCRR